MASPAGYHIKVDSSDVRRALRDLAGRDAPFVTAMALTWTAKDIRQAEVATMQSVFDRPTRFTLNSLQVVPATKTNLNAAVHFKQGFNSVPASRYLMPQVEGGHRSKKSFERALERAGILEADEYAVPGKAIKLDQYGNIRGSDLSRMLSQLKASADPLQNATDSARSSKGRKRGGTIFASRGKGLAPGIYRRRGTGRSIEQLVKFVQGAPDYQPRFPFYQVADFIAATQLIDNARAAFARLVETMRKPK